MFTMYVRIRRDGNIGIGRGTEINEEIVFSFAEAEEVAAAFEKLTQTTGKYKHSYKKIGSAGETKKIKLGRTEDDTILIAGDGQIFLCIEDEIRNLVHELKNLPRRDVAPSSDYVHKIKPDDGKAILLKNAGKSIKVTLQEAALLKIALESSLASVYYKDNIKIGRREILVEKNLSLKWRITIGNNSIIFESHEIDALIEGLQNSIMDVLTDTIKSMSTDSLIDVRIKARAKRVEEDTLKILSEHKKVKTIAKQLAKTTARILTPNLDSDMQTNDFIEMCRSVYSEQDSKYFEPLFKLFTLTFLPDMM
jgi:hypothetical protein